MRNLEPNLSEDLQKHDINQLWNIHLPNVWYITTDTITICWLLDKSSSTKWRIHAQVYVERLGDGTNISSMLSWIMLSSRSCSLSPIRQVFICSWNTVVWMAARMCKPCLVLICCMHATHVIWQKCRVWLFMQHTANIDIDSNIQVHSRFDRP
jgi:hypothetical protein